VLADDAYLVRMALAHLFRPSEAVTVVGQCKDARSVGPLLDRLRADVLITDIQMPAGPDEGFRLVARLRQSHPALGVIVVSTYADVAYALKLFEDGSDGRAYLLKDRIRDRAQLIDAVRAVADGGSTIDPKIVQDLVRTRALKTRSDVDDLAPHELETLALVAEGQSDATIAESRGLTEAAVEEDVDAIFARLGLGDARLSGRRVNAALLYLADPVP